MHNYCYGLSFYSDNNVQTSQIESTWTLYNTACKNVVLGIVFPSVLLTVLLIDMHTDSTNDAAILRVMDPTSKVLGLGKNIYCKMHCVYQEALNSASLQKSCNTIHWLDL